MALPTDPQVLDFDEPAMDEPNGSNYAQGNTVRNAAGVVDVVVDTDRLSNTIRLQNTAQGQWIPFTGWTVIG